MSGNFVRERQRIVYIYNIHICILTIYKNKVSISCYSEFHAIAGNLQTTKELLTVAYCLLYHNVLSTFEIIWCSIKIEKVLYVYYICKQYVAARARNFQTFLARLWSQLLVLFYSYFELQDVLFFRICFFLYHSQRLADFTIPRFKTIIYGRNLESLNQFKHSIRKISIQWLLDENSCSACTLCNLWKLCKYS